MMEAKDSQDPPLSSGENQNRLVGHSPPVNSSQSGSGTTTNHASISNLSNDPPIDPDAWIALLNKEALVLDLESRRLPIDGTKPVLRERLVKYQRERRGEVDRAQMVVDMLVTDNIAQNQVTNPIDARTERRINRECQNQRSTNQVMLENQYVPQRRDSPNRQFARNDFTSLGAIPRTNNTIWNIRETESYDSDRDDPRLRVDSRHYDRNRQPETPRSSRDLSFRRQTSPQQRLDMRNTRLTRDSPRRIPRVNFAISPSRRKILDPSNLSRERLSPPRSNEERFSY